MLNSRISSAVLALATMLAASAAAAQEYTRRSFLTREGHFEITGEPSRPQILRLDVSRGGGHPVFIAPHFYWGLSRDLTIGITHREGLCLNACDRDRHYNDVGFGMLINLGRSADTEINLNTGVQARSLDPFHLGWRGGVLGRVTFSSVAFVFDPSIYIGISGREQGNREQLVLPFWFYFQATPTVTPFVGAMVVRPLGGRDDWLSIPVEGGVLFKLGDSVDLGAYFRFHNLLGRGGNPDGREVGMLARFQF